MSGAVLLLRLAGPLQSWGTVSQYNHRLTASEPTKSGLVGLLAAALGRERDEPITDLTSLRLGVRADQPGHLLRDYHTAADYRGRVLPASQVNKQGLQKPTSPAKPTQQTYRYYLQDAVFVAAFQGPRPLLEQLDAALRSPAFPPALGRRSCPPSRPLAMGLREPEGGDDPLQQQLTDEPWQAGATARKQHARQAETPKHIDLPATVEDSAGEHVLTDVPVSFHPLARSLTERRVHRFPVTVLTGLAAEPGSRRHTGAGHDPFALLGW